MKFLYVKAVLISSDWGKNNTWIRNKFQSVCLPWKKVWCSLLVTKSIPCIKLLFYDDNNHEISKGSWPIWSTCIIWYFKNLAELFLSYLCISFDALHYFYRLSYGPYYLQLEAPMLIIPITLYCWSFCSSIFLDYTLFSL